MLRSLIETGKRNGIHDLQWLDAAQAAAMEPEVRCNAAVLSPSTGIVDVHEYMAFLQADLESRGGAVVFGTAFASAAYDHDGFQVVTVAAAEESSIRCRQLIKSGGLSAPRLLDSIDGYPAGRSRPSYFAKGPYFSCRGASPFKH
jgi:L-2-hydroxyglutarate oxidase LhgO